MFVRNAWYVAATGKEISDEPFARTLLNEPVVLFRNTRGGVAALEDRCCHRGAPLSLGTVTEKGIRCGYHGLEYNCQGICVDIPGQEMIPERARVRCYPAAEKGDYIWIWMGDAAKADVDGIVDYPPDDKLNWPRANDVIHMRASYIMVLENLMDLSHLSYLHKASIGSSEKDSANAEMHVERTQAGMRFLRIMRDADLPPYYAKRYPLKEKIDRWSDFEYVTPSVIKQYTGAVNAGEYDIGIREGGHHVRTLHAVTPETETSCFYFFNKGDGYAKFERPDVARTWGSTTDIFKEDAFMLEQQQLRLENFDTRKLINVKCDVARVQMIRELEERLRKEQERAEAG